MLLLLLCVQVSPTRERKESSLYFYEKPHNFKVRLSLCLDNDIHDLFAVCVGRTLDTLCVIVLAH